MASCKSMNDCNGMENYEEMLPLCVWCIGSIVVWLEVRTASGWKLRPGGWKSSLGDEMLFLLLAVSSETSFRTSSMWWNFHNRLVIHSYFDFLLLNDQLCIRAAMILY